MVRGGIRCPADSRRFLADPGILLQILADLRSIRNLRPGVLRWASVGGREVRKATVSKMIEFVYQESSKID